MLLFMFSVLNGPCFALIMASSMAGWSLPLFNYVKHPTFADQYMDIRLTD